MNRMFFHIPRTAGSSIWASLADAATESGVRVFDIYNYSIRDFGDPSHSAEVLQSRNSREIGDCLFHHHTLDGVLEFVKDPVLATIVRDPIDRFVSDIAHYRRVLQPGVLPDAHRDVVGQLFGPELVDQMSDADVPLDTVLLKTARLAYFRWHYIRHFERFLGFDGNQEKVPLDMIARVGKYLRCEAEAPVRQHLLALAEFARTRFAVIGYYPAVDYTLVSICRAFNLPVQKSTIRHINKGARGIEVAPAIRKRLKSMFKLDYIFLEKLIGGGSYGATGASN